MCKIPGHKKGDVKDEIQERVDNEQYGSCFYYSKEYYLWLAVKQERA